MIINDFFTNPKRSARNVAENSQRVDSLVTDALRVMKGPEVSDAVLALKRVLGDREYNSRRGFYSFYVDQIHKNWQLPMYGQQNLAEDADDYLDSDPATGTGDYMHRQDVNGTPTTTFRQNVPAAELAKLRSQHFNEDINRMQNLAGIRKK